MDIPLSLIIMGLNQCLAIFIDASRTAVNDLSGGNIRTIDSNKKRIIQKAESWLQNKKEYSFTLRMLVFINTTVFILTAHSYFFENFNGTSFVYSKYIPLVGAILLFVLIKEILGTIWLGSYNIRYLKFAMPVIEIPRIFFKPLILITLKISTILTSRKEDESETIENKATAEDEILSLVENDGKEDSLTQGLEEDERRMIKGIFDLDDSDVKEVMTPRVDVEGIECESTIAEARKRFTETSRSRLPVFKESIDNIIGIILAKDLLNDEKILGIKSVESIAYKPNFIPETKNLGDLLEEFQKSKNHLAVVVDEYGGTSGIVTIEDILEEIVGEIHDEYDVEEEEIFFERKEKNIYIVDARLAVSDFIEKTECDLEEREDVETIGGFIYSEIGRIPEQGEMIKTDDFEAEILDSDERTLKKLKIILHKKTEKHGSEKTA